MADTKNEVDGIHDNAMPLVDKQDDNGIIIENTDLDVSSHRRQRCKGELGDEDMIHCYYYYYYYYCTITAN